MTTKRRAVPWRPTVAVFRTAAWSSVRGRRIARRLERFSVPVQMSDAAWPEVAESLRVAGGARARTVLLVETTPLRPVRLEAFPHVVTRPDYQFATVAFNCPFHCEYCYLYANSAGVRPAVCYTDLSPVFRAISDLRRRHSALTFNFGEDSDSLALEHLSGTAAELIRYFGRQGSTLELRTKAPFLPQVARQPHNGNTIIGVSLTPASLAARYEHGSATLPERLDALRRYGNAGFHLGLKFEPGLLVPDWRGLYAGLVHELSEGLRDVAPHHASLGCLRYRPELKAAIGLSFPKNDLLIAADAEYLPNRFSYPLDWRLAFYEFMIRELRQVWPSLPIYLSMENSDVCERLDATPWIGGVSATDREVYTPESAIDLSL